MVDADIDAVFAVADLIRLGKSEYEFLQREGHVATRGRRPAPCLRIDDFVSNFSEKAALTHWLQNPASVQPDVISYASKARELLPGDLFDRCAQFAVTQEGHPFFSDFQMNRRLLPRQQTEFTFIDLFAGIGGFRLAMQQEGGKCLFASEIDQGAVATYTDNFGVVPFGDITKADTKAMIPKEFDILCGGFPCQAFSTAGLRDGFEDKLQRGTLYKQIVEIAKEHRPKAIFCENVKGLLSSADGNALQIISREIEGAGYNIVFNDILDSMDYGVPQHRERLYIVALRSDIYNKAQQREIAFPAPPDPISGHHPRNIGEILEDGPVSKSYYLGEKYLDTLVKHRARHAGTGNGGFGFIVRNRNDVAGTLMCGGMGRERNIIQDDNQTDWDSTMLKKIGGINSRHLRFLTTRECARLQGFPDYFAIPDSIQAGYRQFGNCVTVKTVRAVGRAILNYMRQCEAEVRQ